ncbi:hypothetical protein [Blastococcus xanthinilyticus]|uniref:Uncharacterized protein n=1 Tax=Blastococcus xanthinilyticus TaxID=1564164 RepID=A0A5S5CLP4_9ACTN|nr:hypothetical protein [Blastococcus xanthinilyticus]TYP82040.1 hypothetical protein BD833_12024 [Blastococcus xanthinilyticus]
MSAVEHAQPCRGCGAPVLHVVDVDTDEPIVVDAATVDGGRIVLWSIKGNAFARRYGQPARLQPAWAEHRCPAPNLSVPPAAAVDPYEDASAAAQQHGGWRS